MRMDIFTIFLTSVVSVIGVTIGFYVYPWILGTRLIFPPTVTIKHWISWPEWMNFSDWLTDLPARVREMLLIPQDIIYLAFIVGLAVIFLAFYERKRPKCSA